MIVKNISRGWEVYFDKTDLVRWKKLLTQFRPFVKMPKRGLWLRVSNSELWAKFVAEYMVRGGTRLIDRMEQDPTKKDNFLKKTSLNSLATARSPLRQLENAFRGNTRFWRTAARAIERSRSDKEVVRGGRFVLLEGLSKMASEAQLRNELLGRCPPLGLKGASNFLINIGAARDLAAIDTRTVRCLEKHFGAGQEIHRAQSSPQLYLAVESALREVAKRNHIPLSQLDRTIFQASAETALDFLLKAGES